MEVLIQPDARAAAGLVARIIKREVQKNPRLVLGLATGCTMEPVYAQLVQMHQNDGLDFSKSRTFNLDEYVGLSGSHRNSYRHYMNQHFFRQVNIDLPNTHLPDGMADDLDVECENYERLIHQAGGIDLQLLGIGQSGHIGFNEPLSAFRSRTRVVPLGPTTIQQNAPMFGGTDKMPRQAMTMGVGTILDCRRCILLATGEEKAEIVAGAVEGPMTGMIPASVLQWHPNCVVVLDEAAASGFTKLDYYRWIYDAEPKWDWLRKYPAAVRGNGCESDFSARERHLESRP